MLFRSVTNTITIVNNSWGYPISTYDINSALFDEAVARSMRSWYAMVRRDATREAKSELQASQVPGAKRSPEAEPDSREDPTVAMILPRYPSIIASGRVGTVGADPDSDGVIRRFDVYNDEGDWRVPSLPMQVAASAGAAAVQRRAFRPSPRMRAARAAGVR